MEEEEYNKLPVDEKCVHKLWKARVSGYEEVTKLFRQIDDEKSPEFGKYLGLVKKFVVDSNAMGQEKGLEATLAYVENYAHAGKTVFEVMSGIVTKCIAAPKTKTKELALQVTLMYIEIEKHEAVEEELIKGMELKNPKIVTACVSACTVALREFGSKIINVKPLLKKISVLLADRDKAVRDETKAMIVEMYRWIGGALRPQLQAANLQPVQITELEAEFAKIESQKATPTRYIRSQQVKQAKLAEQAAAGAAEEEEEVDAAVPEIDQYELASAVEILSKLPKDFYEKVEAKKWQERKESLDLLENLVKVPKLENGDYGDLVRALKKIIQKDSNVVCVATAGRCIAGLATGLKKKFQTYSGFCVSSILEKFKEKKQNVVTAMREAIDAVYLTTNLEAILEDVSEALNNKNPSVKSETCLFLARAFTKTAPSTVNKKLLKAITSALTKTINESDPAVREASAESLGTLMKLVGEKTICPFMVELEKDTLKMAKIKEFYDSAVILNVRGTKKEGSKAPVKAVPKAVVKPEVKKTAVTTKKTREISSGTATVVRSKGSKALSKSSSQNIERELGDDEAEGIVGEVITVNIADITNTSWKARLAATEQLLAEIKALDSKSVPTQAIVKFLAKKPGLKDTNFQVMKTKIEIIKYLAENCRFTITTAGCCVTDISEKFSDNKNGTAVAETLSAIAEATSLGQVADMVLEFAFTQKSPKVQQEALAWLAGAIKEFGFSNMNVKFLIDNCKKALGSTNQGVRQTAIPLLGIMYLYMGATLNVFFENEKPALRDQIHAECDKYEGEKPPPPTRGIAKSASTDSLDVVGDDEPEQINIQDLIPRVDISSQISEAILTELTNKDWKVRNEAVTKISTIISEAKFIKPNLGELPQALAARLTDSNVKIAQSTLMLCETIAKAMGAPFKQYIRVFFPGILQGLGDNKSFMRTSSMDTIHTFSDQCGYKEFFENEMIADALKNGSPLLRIELWNWLAEKLPKIVPKQIPKDELVICIPHLYSNLEDRNADVRKNAQEAILGFMIHLGYDSMVKHAEKLKPGSKIVITTALEKTRPNLPVKPLPKKQSMEKEDKAVRGTKPVANAKNAVKSKSATSSKTATAQTTRKKDDDIDTSPLLVVNNFKHQRTIDEQKLKVLKWNFTQPREEFVDLLKDQMATANINRTLTSNMFHSDFRYHIKALEALTDDLADNSQALMSNLDLILKWLTLRFFDTNPSVLLKGLEYLQLVFNTLIESKYRLLENEASSFLPYLINKIGDPKDSVRNGVKALLHQLNRLFPVNKLSIYVMEGVKSKNARQRAECLEVMGGLIEDFGITICMPTASACLKDVAKQISDRDNSVRNAALNCVVQAYNIVGEKVYRLVGNISDKDMSLLEERIKRSSRKTVMPKTELNSTVVTTMISPQKENTPPNKNELETTRVVSEEVTDSDPEEDIEEVMLPPVNLPQMINATPPKEIQGPFKLDPDFMKELERVKPPKPIKPTLSSYDLDFLNEEVRIPTIEEAKAKVQSGATTQPVVFGETVSRVSMGSPSPKKQDLIIERLIKQMSNQNPTVALAGMTQLHEILAQPRGNSVSDYEDEFMNTIISQFKQLRSADLTIDTYAIKMYRNLLTTIDAFYNNKTLGSHISTPVIKELINQMITLLVEERLKKVLNGEAYVRVINLHCVKVIERSNHTHTICALVKLINECISNDSSARQVDLVMKCLWRVIKLMPQWGDDIDYDFVLLEVHNFLKKFPSSWWKNKEVDTPLRTVKTILHSSAKFKGGTIMLHLGKIPNTGDSEVESYILRILKSLKISEIQHIPVKQETQRRSLSRANHKMLTDIFQKIGSKDETKEGLNLLYDFLQQHSEADIEPFLSNSSTFFQDYIKNGLKEIEDSRKSCRTRVTEKAGDHAQEKSEFTIPHTDPSKGPDYWKQRLNMWNQLFDDVKSGKNIEIPE